MAERLAAFRGWVAETALPVWAERGFDTRAGRFHERLDLAGRPLAVPHRAMVQARQIYVYAHAALAGWYRPGAALADAAAAALRRDFRDEAAGYRFSIACDGGPAAGHSDAYSTAFVLFALAWMHRLTGDGVHLDEADRLLAHLDDELVDPVHGGLFDTAPIGGRGKRQNPLMHLLEACLALDAAAPAREYRARADGIVALFHARLFDRDRGVLTEHFAEDWAAHPDRALAGLVEPGHHFEWVWLLDAHGGDDGGAAAAALYRTACAHGFAPAGLIRDAIGADLAPRLLSHRVWPHAEAIKAAVVRARAGDRAALGLADAMAGMLLDHFLDRPFAGGWIDRLDAMLVPAVDHVPASTLYHLFLAATVAAEAPAAAAAVPEGVH